MFSDADFDVCMELEELDIVLTDKTSIIIKHNNCSVCSMSAPDNPHLLNELDYPHNHIDYYRIEGSKLTIKYIIKQLIKKGFNPACNHRFLESFELCSGSDADYEACCGS